MNIKESRLANLTKKMDVPEWKRTNLKWLKENLAKRNSDNPLFQDAMEIIEELLIENNLTKHK